MAPTAQSRTTRRAATPRPGLGLLLWLALGATACGASGDPITPNVILISIDTLRADFLACYGHARVTAPALDRMAAEGTLFEDVTAAAPWTLPSHASMLSGLYPSTHGVKDHGVGLDRETLGTWLQARGFQTYAVVNSHNIGDPRYGLMRGFDDAKWEFEMDIVDGAPGKKILNKGPAINATAKEWMTKRDPSRPFFFFLHYYDVHTDFTPEDRWREKYVAPYDGELTGVTGQLVKMRNHMEEAELEEADFRHLAELYEAEIRTFDAVLEDLFEFLDREGLSDTTVVAVTSDHGEEYGEHGGLLHGRTHYQELVHIPLILRGPGVPVGQRVPDPVHLVDVAPTLFSLAQVEPPGDLDGIDLSLHWRAPDQVPSVRFIFSEADHNNVVDGETVNGIRSMVRVGDDKLTYDRSTRTMELFDLSQDPTESVDRSEEDPERRDALWSKLQVFLERSGGGVSTGEQSPEDIELLKKLGYIDADE